MLDAFAELHWSQLQAGQILGDSLYGEPIDRATISRWLNSKQPVPAEVIGHIRGLRGARRDDPEALASSAKAEIEAAGHKLARLIRALH